MNRRVAVVLVLTFLALVGATLWVPTTIAYGAFAVPPQEPNPPSAFVFGPLDEVEWNWVWADWSEFEDLPSAPLRGRPPNAASASIMLEVRLHWPLLVSEMGAILLLGVGLLTWLVLRERRRRAAAAA